MDWNQAKGRCGVRQSGFTIVELIVVIILLGILAATALPRFIDVDEQAHEAAVGGVQGGLQTGVSLFHAQWIADGQPGTNSQIVEFNNLRVNGDGFPYGLVDNSGGSSTVTTSADCQAVFQSVLQGGGPTVSNAANLAGVVGSITDYTAVVSVPDCQYYYTGQDNVSGASIPMLTYVSTQGLVSQTTVALP